MLSYFIGTCFRFGKWHSSFKKLISKDYGEKLKNIHSKQKDYLISLLTDYIYSNDLIGIVNLYVGYTDDSCDAIIKV